MVVRNRRAHIKNGGNVHKCSQLVMAQIARMGRARRIELAPRPRKASRLGPLDVHLDETSLACPPARGSSRRRHSMAVVAWAVEDAQSDSSGRVEGDAPCQL